MKKATCERCGRVAWVNLMTLRGTAIGHYCGDCWDHVPHDPPARNKTQASSGRNHNDPGLDNAVRALEEDR